MLDSNLKTPIYIVALHYSNDEMLNDFIENTSFASEISIINLTEKPLTVINEKVKIYEINDEKIQFIFEKISETYKNQWILYLHTTYRVENRLFEEIKTVLNNYKSEVFMLSKVFYFYSKKMNFGTIEKSSEPLLYLNNSKNNNAQNIYKTELKANKSIRNKIHNISYNDFDSYTKGLANLNKIQAEYLFSKNLKPSIFTLLFRPFSFFFWNYFVKGGFFDGKEGFILCYLHSFNKLRLYLSIWLKHNNLS